MLAASPLRVQQHGPECTQVTVPLNGPSHDACGMNDKIQMQHMEKVIDCVNRGGPGRAGIVGNLQKRASAAFSATEKIPKATVCGKPALASVEECRLVALIRHAGAA
jgi:hypothetical protein